MVILYCSFRLLGRDAAGAAPFARSAGPLGDWYAHPLTGPEPRVACVNPRSQLALVFPEPPRGSLAGAFHEALQARLDELALPVETVERQLAALLPTLVVPARRRDLPGDLYALLVDLRARARHCAHWPCDAIEAAWNAAPRASLAGRTPAATAVELLARRAEVIDFCAERASRRAVR